MGSGGGGARAPIKVRSASGLSDSEQTWSSAICRRRADGGVWSLALTIWSVITGAASDDLGGGEGQVAVPRKSGKRLRATTVRLLQPRCGRCTLLYPTHYGHCRTIARVVLIRATLAGAARSGRPARRHGADSEWVSGTMGGKFLTHFSSLNIHQHCRFGAPRPSPARA